MRKTLFIALLIALMIFVAINIKAITKIITDDIKYVQSATEITKIYKVVNNEQIKNTNNNINIKDTSTKIINENISIKFLLSNTTTLMTSNEIMISTTKASDFNKNSLEQREAQQMQQHLLCNEHPQCDNVQHTSSIVTNGIENNTNISRTSETSRTFNNNNTNNINSTSTPLQIDAKAKGYKNLLTPKVWNSVNTTTTSVTTKKINNNGINNNVPLTLLSTATSESSQSPSPSPSPSLSSSTFNVARNGFRDKINISNQRNEFTSEVYKDDAVIAVNVESASHVDDSISLKTLAQGHFEQSALRSTQKYNFNSKSNKNNLNNNSTTSVTNNNNIIVPATSAFFEHVELMESTLSPDKRHELLLHRRKRYLLFPEGSSFQLVFDLIIGIVDYSSYLILGITCAVAWELPSKPPSEIIENFRDKLNEGTYGYQRRNDSIDDKKLQYVDVQSKNPTNLMSTTAATVPMKNINFRYENPWKAEKYENIGNYYQQKYATKAPTTTSNIMNYYGYKAQHRYGGNGEAVAAATSTSTTAGDGGASDMAGGGFGFTDAQRKTLNDKASQWNWHWNRPEPEPERPYTKYNKKYYTKPKNEWRNNDKWKYASGASPYSMGNLDWRRQGTSGGDNHDRQDDYIADSVRYDERQQQRNYAGWRQKDNWWQANRQRWHDKQHQWMPNEVQRENPNGYGPKRPILVYATPNSASPNSYPRTGRQRKLLKSPPKHHIYPVFGRKKRSLEGEASPLEFEFERIHFREQLQSRQKLYGKIEQLFQTRGHNGTACVLRALCETGQRHQQLPLHHRHSRRQHQSYHDHQHHQQEQPHSTTGQLSGPQSFITELLRAIFALPKDILRSREFEAEAMHPHAGRPSSLELLQREFVQHISWHYRDAHSYTGNCAERFSSCEHSIWNDGIGHSGVVIGQTFKM